MNKDDKKRMLPLIICVPNVPFSGLEVVASYFSSTSRCDGCDFFGVSILYFFVWMCVTLIPKNHYEQLYFNNNKSD